MAEGKSPAAMRSASIAEISFEELPLLSVIEWLDEATMRDEGSPSRPCPFT
jgi:hypothetical protein